MKLYTKPVITIASGEAEGVYLASGSGGVKCDSKYMNGNWQPQNTLGWAPGETKSYKEQFGCLGCPANRAYGCGLQSDYVASGNASSYDQDNGNRMPSWEKKGYGPDDGVTDWSV